VAGEILAGMAWGSVANYRQALKLSLIPRILLGMQDSANYEIIITSHRIPRFNP
jgi:hypothetical protein